jgi:hypothetical protein
MRIELSIGLLSVALSFVLTRFIKAPAFVSGLLIGFGLCFLIIGALPITAYDKIKGLKESIKGFFV